MLKSSQIVFLIDISTPLSNYKADEQIKKYESSIILSCVRLLTELGALCRNGAEGLRWGYKFYDSLVFKPETTQKTFFDFNFKSFEKFEEELNKKHSFKRINYNNGAETSPISRDHSHAYILNKALQEILLDYDWDRPDISSPVKCLRRKNGEARVTRSTFRDSDDSGPLNIVLVFNDFPKNAEDLISFCKCDGKKSNDLILNILDKSTQLGLKEDKKIRLHFVNSGTTNIQNEFNKKLNTALIPINGSIHELNNIVSLSQSSNVCNNIGKNDEGSLFSNDSISKYSFTNFGIGDQFWKPNQKVISRNRLSQKGPLLVWEDENGFSFINLQLQVLSIKGSSTQEWDTLTVCGVIRGEAMALLGLAVTNSNLFICHTTQDATFKVILDILHAQQLVMILRHKCGGLAALSPWIGGTGYLVIFSSSGLANPPIHMNHDLMKATSTNETHSKVISNIIKKTLKLNHAIPVSGSAPACHQFSHQHLRAWFPASSVNEVEIKSLNTKFNGRRKQMMERLQKKYRPQIPKALSGSSLPPQVLVDVTQPTSAAAMPECGQNFAHYQRRSHIVTRGQQIAQRGQMLKAQKKAKQMETEALELQEANKKRVEVAEKRSKMLSYLTAKVMDAIGGNTDGESVLSNLQKLRDQPNYGKEKMSIDESDYLIVVVHAIVGVALNVIKLKCPKFLVNSQLKETLSDGIFLSASQITNSYVGKDQVRQLKIQALLHFEVLWLSGYADSLSDDGHACKEKNWHVEEIIKHLRAISLHHDIATMSSFLDIIILPNYENTMGEILVEVYEELNHPLANSIACYSQHQSSPEPMSPMVIEKQSKSAPKAKSPKRSHGRMPLKRHGSQRQIVINVSKKSTNRVSTGGNPSSKLKNVKRSLFDKDNGKLSSTRCNPEPTIRSVLKTPSKSDKLPVFKTPKSGTKRSLLWSPTDTTPTKCDGSEPKRRRIFAPETPAKQIGKNVFNVNRLCKSTGETTVKESPDVKRSHMGVNGNENCNYAISKSFYAGKVSSRNFEKGRKKVLVSQISASVNRRCSMPSKLSNGQNIFSNILQAMAEPQDENRVDSLIKLTFS